jgi:hypothetical protein
MLAGGLRVEPADDINPAKIGKQDMTYNMGRFGYRELGKDMKQGDRLCLEYVITAMLISGDARRMEAVPVLLAKNRPSYGLLLFLCGKYGQLESLLGLLKTLVRIRRSKDAQDAVHMLEMLGNRARKTDERSVRQKMRLYNAI